MMMAKRSAPVNGEWTVNLRRSLHGEREGDEALRGAAGGAEDGDGVTAHGRAGVRDRRRTATTSSAASTCGEQNRKHDESNDGCGTGDAPPLHAPRGQHGGQHRQSRHQPQQ